MTNQYMENVRTILLSGSMHFFGNSNSSFVGPLKEGLRPIVWHGEDMRTSTSCSLISDVEIYLGETKSIKIIILNERQ